MTCSSVHISSWIRLWLLNFCHPPETSCSGLHCWKERMMEKISIQIFELLCLRDYSVLSFQLVQRKSAGSINEMTSLSSLWLIVHILREAVFNGIQQYLWSTFSEPGIIPDVEKHQWTRYRKPLPLWGLHFRDWPLLSLLQICMATEEYKRMAISNPTQFPTYKYEKMERYFSSDYMI